LRSLHGLSPSPRPKPKLEKSSSARSRKRAAGHEIIALRGLFIGPKEARTSAKEASENGDPYEMNRRHWRTDHRKVLDFGKINFAAPLRVSGS
ncbi:hypothetical protein, partial [Rubellimicrobium aerolatum]